MNLYVTNSLTLFQLSCSRYHRPLLLQSHQNVAEISSWLSMEHIHSCHSYDSGAAKNRWEIVKTYPHDHTHTYPELPLEAIELLPTHGAVIAKQPLWGFLDEGCRSHRSDRDMKPLPLQLRKHGVDSFIACLLPKGRFPLSDQL